VSGLGVVLLGVSTRYLAREITTSQHTKQVFLPSLPLSWWYVKKLLRAGVTRTGMGVTCCLGIVIAIVGDYWGGLDAGAAGGIASLLAAAFTSDIRTILRKIRPFEIVGLRGVGYFGCVQLLGAFLLSFTAISPLTLLLPLTQGYDMLLEFGLSVVLGMSAGLFASTLIAAQARDITAQCGASLLAISLMLLPQFPPFVHFPQTILSISKGGLVVVLLGLIWIIEYKRNTYFWRKTDAART
jgi:hypothetical protein